MLASLSTVNAAKSTLEVPLDIPASLLATIPNSHASGHFTLIQLDFSQSQHTPTFEINNINATIKDLSSCTSNSSDITPTAEPLMLLHRSFANEVNNDGGVLILLMPDNVSTLKKFTFASLLTSIGRKLSVSRTTTVNSISAISPLIDNHNKNTDDKSSALSNHEKVKLKVLEDIETERKELIKQHSENKMTEAAVSGGYHTITLNWQNSIQASIRDLITSAFLPSLTSAIGEAFDRKSNTPKDLSGYWLSKKIVNSTDGLPLICKYIQFQISECEKQLIGSNIKTVWTSSPFFPATQSPDEPRFYIVAYPWVDRVRCVLVHWIPDGARPKTKMLYSSAKPPFKKHLMEILENERVKLDDQVTFTTDDAIQSIKAIDEVIVAPTSIETVEDVVQEDSGAIAPSSAPTIGELSSLKSEDTFFDALSTHSAQTVMTLDSSLPFIHQPSISLPSSLSLVSQTSISIDTTIAANFINEHEESLVSAQNNSNSNHLVQITSNQKSIITYKPLMELIKEIESGIKSIEEERKREFMNGNAANQLRSRPKPLIRQRGVNMLFPPSTGTK